MRRWFAALPSSVTGTLVKVMALIGYSQVSKADGSQVIDLQRDALAKAGVDLEHHLYSDAASIKLDDRPALDACIKALRHSDTLVVWKLDRLGRDLRHIVNLVGDPTKRGIRLKVLAGKGALIDTTTANGRLAFAIFAGLAEFEHELIVERTKAGLAPARARSRSGGRPSKMTTAKLRLAQAGIGKPETKAVELCAELGITRQTLYRHVTPKDEIRPDGEAACPEDPMIPQVIVTHRRPTNPLLCWDANA